MSRADLVTYRVRFPLDVDPQALEAVFVGLSSLPGPQWYRLFAPAFVAIEVVSTVGGIEHFVTVPKRWEAMLTGRLRTHIGVRLEPAEDRSSIAPRRGADRHQAAVELRLVHGRELLRVDNAEAVASALLGSLQPVRRDEQLRLQWLLTPAAPHNPYPTNQPRPGAFGWAQRIDPRQRQKAADVPFLAAVRLQAEADSTNAARHLVRRPLAVLTSVRYGWNSLRPRVLPAAVVGRRVDRIAVPFLWPARVSARELVAMSGLPVGSPAVPGLTLGVARQLPPTSYLPRRGRVLLHATYPGAERPVAMTARGALGHLVILGPTGSGKSSLLAHLAISDMRAGYGVILLDPKGDTASDVLSAVPPSRLDDVIYLDPADDYPVGFNLLSARGDRLEITVDQVVAWFARRYHGSWGPRSDDLGRHALRTLAAANQTMAELPLLIGSEVFRRRIVGSLNDELLRGFWAWFDALSVAERSHIAAPLLNKARALLGRERLRTIVGQRGAGWSVEAVLSERKILIANLAKGVIGEDASGLLGSLLLSRAWLATLARAAVAPEQRAPAFILVDEFADFIGAETGFGDFLAQARGLGVSLTLATQHLGQVPTALRQDVLANARSKLTFAAPADDATILARDFAPQLSASDLQHLGPFEVAARVFTGTTVAPPVTGRTPEPLVPNPKRSADARARSRASFGRARADVEAEIHERQAAGVPMGAIGRRRIAS